MVGECVPIQNCSLKHKLCLPSVDWHSQAVSPVSFWVTTYAHKASRCSVAVHFCLRLVFAGDGWVCQLAKVWTGISCLTRHASASTKSAPRSPMIMVAELVFDETIVGMIDALSTRRRNAMHAQGSANH